MDKVQHPLNATVVKVLEDWAMMLVDPSEPSMDLFDLDDQFYLCTVNLRGVITGSVSMLCQKKFLTHLANNVLGEPDDAEHSELECIDAFKEMGNVTCGNYITFAYGDDVVFDLLEPHVTEIAPEDVEKFIRRPFVFAYSADELPLLTSFSID